MKKKKQKKEINIKSNETKIIIGLVLSLLGLTVLLSPFFQAAAFTLIKSYFGYASAIWGLTLIYVSLRFLSSHEKLRSTRFLIGAVMLSLNVNIFFTFIIPRDVLTSMDDFSSNGGLIGLALHKIIYSSVGGLIEFLILLIIFIVSFSLLSGVKLEQMKDFFARIFNRKNGTTEDKHLGLVDLDKELKDVKINISDSNNSEKEDLQKPVQSTDSMSNKINVKNNADKYEEDIEPPEDEYYTTQKELKEEESIEPSEPESPQYEDWQYPPPSIFKEPVKVPQDTRIHERNAKIIEHTLMSFGIKSKVTDIAIGPTVVQYALSITVGTKVAKVKNLANDLALALATSASAVRIEAPIPGTSLIGIEIPNPTPNFVYIREMVSVLKSSTEKFELPIILGKNVAGSDIIRDLTKLPHLLVAGATGTGKSVGTNTILTGLLSVKSPDELKIILVDPKMVEMAPYNGIPHLLTPVITDMELVVNALQWTIEEMLRRYRMLKQVGARKLKEYNQKIGYNAMPYIVVVIDEMADLMLTTGADVESKIVRLTQMSRAVGIHLIIATQRPSVDVITGLIKANVPGRISYSVATAIDSRVIIDQSGAETLIGNGDMLFKSPADPRPIRIQGAYTDTQDTEHLIEFIKDQAGGDVEYSEEVVQPKQEAQAVNTNVTGIASLSEDDLFEDSVNIIVNAQKGSASLLQRKLRIGYNRAARIMDELENAGVVGPQDGSNPRDVLITSVEQLLQKVQPKTGTSDTYEVEDYETDTE